MTDKHKFSKPVAFNVKNPTDKAIADYVKKRNFSGYVKKLITADMQSKGIDVPKRKKTDRNAVVVNEIPTQTESKLERLKRQLADKRINDKARSDSDT